MSAAASSHRQNRETTLLLSPQRWQERFLSIDGLAPLSRKEVQCPPHPGNSRKILYIREHFSDRGYAGWGESSVESISEATGLCETEFGNWKSLFSQEYTLA